MIRFGKCLIEPSYTRNPAYTGGLFSKEKFAFYSWQCGICQNDVQVVLNDYDILSSLEFSPSDKQIVKDKFEIGIIGASKDGGGPCFKRVECPHCSLVYLGVREPRNSLYLVTVQAICEQLEE